MFSLSSVDNSESKLSFENEIFHWSSKNNSNKGHFSTVCLFYVCLRMVTIRAKGLGNLGAHHQISGKECRQIFCAGLWGCKIFLLAKAGIFS